MVISKLKKLTLPYFIFFLIYYILFGATNSSSEIIKKRDFFLFLKSPTVKYRIPLEKNRIAVIVSQDEKYYKLEIYKLITKNTYKKTFSSQEFFLPKITIENGKILIEERIPLENFNLYTSPLTITYSLIKTKDGKYKLKPLPVSSPINEYYLGKKLYFEGNFTASFKHFLTFWNKYISSYPQLKLDTLFYLTKISATMDKKFFTRFFQLLKKYDKDKIYLSALDTTNPFPDIERKIQLAIIKFSQNNYKEAIKLLLKAQNIAKEKSQVDYLAQIYYRLGLNYEKLGKHSLARNFYLQAKTLKSNSIWSKYATLKLTSPTTQSTLH